MPFAASYSINCIVNPWKISAETGSLEAHCSLAASLCTQAVHVGCAEFPGYLSLVLGCLGVPVLMLNGVGLLAITHSIVARATFWLLQSQTLTENHSCLPCAVTPSTGAQVGNV